MFVIVSVFHPNKLRLTIVCFCLQKSSKSNKKTVPGLPYPFKTPSSKKAILKEVCYSVLYLCVCTRSFVHRLTIYIFLLFYS